MTSPTPEAPESLYDQDTTPRLVQVPPVTFLYVDGHGDPTGDPSFGAVVGGLYAVCAALAPPAGAGAAPAPPVLECLWWADDMASFSRGDRSEWSWRAMVRPPSTITDETLDAVVGRLHADASLPTEVVPRSTTFDEGLAAQVLHLGTYDTETSTIERLHTFIHEQECWFDGSRQRHHEIYLSDPGRVPPEQRRTIVRQPCTQMT